MITRSAIVTLILFFLSAIFVIRPLSFHVPLPLIGRRKVTIGLQTAPIIAIAILWASQCLGATQIRNGIVGTDDIKPYNIVILFFSLAYMSITLDVTGFFQAAAFWVSNKGGSSGRKLYFYFYLLLTLIGMIVGNDPAILFGTVFVVHFTAATGLDPDAWLISEFAAANTASMVLFVGNPTNVVICEGFRINNAAFTAYTILPFIACSIACYLILMLQYRNEKHVPRELNVSGRLNPGDVLPDPVGAIFGSVWLAICLIVVIILSFFPVDVWKAVLPFAGGKFIFDISWDHYRYSTSKIPKLDENRRDVADDRIAAVFHRATSDDIQHNEASQSAHTLQNDEDASGNAPKSSTLPYLNNTLQRAPGPDTPPRATTPRSIREPWPKYKEFPARFPTFFTALPQLPFILVLFAFSQFILIEALAHQGWVDIFAGWLVTASNKQIMPVVWLVGVSGVILCNISGTSIGATILLTKIIRASNFPDNTARAAAVSLAVASNIGAVSFTFSASLGGLLWVAILKDKGIKIKQWKFAMWNTLPLIAMTGVGLGVVSAMMAVLY
ncbi:hypothetical protein EST38_g8192 [Candolleomyces aberdarensis]|uniref:Citrate transporter-like domain-containing protein n=1 Tax=Candolleomyces aberdarensis TaxID=2316362 RepID=A0A4Q2DD51_9AGAR|nr:hypothetical protein EST38_g8192 [Candolleomyces aberdarensis]